MSNSFFSPNTRRALTAQLLLSLIIEHLPIDRRPISVARLTAHLTHEHDRLTGDQIVHALAVGQQQARITLTHDGRHVARPA